MGLANKPYRTNAIPFRATWWDSSAIGNAFDSEAGGTSGDLALTLATGQGNGGLIRIARPAKGDLISARLTLNAVTPVLSPTSLRFAVGTFAADGVTAVEPDEATVQQHMEQIFGNSAAHDFGSQDNVFYDGFELGMLIPKRGDPDFNEDGWVLFVDLVNRDPADWTLFTFKIDCTVQLGAT